MVVLYNLWDMRFSIVVLFYNARWKHMKQALATGGSNNALVCMILLYFIASTFLHRRRETMKAFPSRRSESTMKHIVCKKMIGDGCSPTWHIREGKRDPRCRLRRWNYGYTNNLVASLFCSFPLSLLSPWRQFGTSIPGFTARPPNVNIQTWDYRHDQHSSCCIILEVGEKKKTGRGEWWS